VDYPGPYRPIRLTFPIASGTVIQQHRIADPANPGNPQSDMELWVVDTF